MTTTHCPDCHAPTYRRRRTADARCDDCRALVGHRRGRAPDQRTASVRDLGPGLVP